jgi:hypothetical protein
MNKLRTVIVPTLLTLALTGTGHPQTKAPKSNDTALNDIVAACEARVNRAKLNVLREQQKMLHSHAAVEACYESQWPDTPECNKIARAVAKTVMTTFKDDGSLAK